MESRKQRIKVHLQSIFQIQYISVEDESHQHSVPESSESHFKITLVSEGFDNMPRIDRHRLVNSHLTAEFNAGLHALSLHLFTPLEWESRQKQVKESPVCRGGSRHG